MAAIDVFVEDVNKFQEEFNDAVHAGQRLCFITRGKELQVEARDTLASVSTKAGQLKETAIANEYEDVANALLSLEAMANAIINELNMWITIKEENYAEAWDFLVNAQTSAIAAMCAHDIANHLEGYVAHLSALEKHIFPNHGFLSIGAIVQKSECSICGQEHGTCDHLVGKPYMGKMCCEVVTECELEEISFVKIPGNKQCRVMSFTDDDGRTIDTFTLRTIPSDSSPKESC